MRKCFVRYGVSIVLILLFTVVPFLIFAQIGDPGAVGPDPDVPIDGGLSILIAAGVGYGIKKLRDERKKNQFNSN